jgi:diguanylate cyclase (GGDEF)-like protein
VAIENYTIYVVTYTLTAFLSLLLGFSVTVFNEFIIEKLASLEARYYDASRTDKLTGLANQMRFSQYIDSLKKNYKEGETLNLMFIDVDNFKSINDNYGHLVGNDVLVLLAKAFTMTPHELTIRWGGDEFVIIEKNKTKEEFVKEANDLIKTVSEIRHPDHPDLQVTISVGVSIQKIDKNFSFDKFINSADDSVNKAKRQGKNQVQM